MKLHCGDCLEILPTLDECSIDSCVTDPPYGLEFMGKDWDSFGRNSPPSFKHSMQNNYKGFKPPPRPGGLKIEGMRAFQDFSHQWAREVYRVLKPGAHLLAFGGTRTYHRMACAIEDAGFEIRDQIQWLYGSGFPKSHNQGNGWGTALKPANEPIVLARKPLSEKTVAANVLKWGTGAINVDGCRVETNELADKIYNNSGANLSWGGTYGKGTVEGNKIGRWPANVIHDGSEEVVGAFPSPHGAGSARVGGAVQSNDGAMFGVGNHTSNGTRIGDKGSAARFFYCAKASKKDRNGSKHPTVKPLKLMRYLCRLITPPGGLILDPFAGSGTTGQAAIDEGFRAVLIERETEYQADIKRRVDGQLFMASQ